MKISDLQTASAECLAPILLSAIQRLGQLGRTGAVALAQLVDDGDADFDEAAQWIDAITRGELRE